MPFSNNARINPQETFEINLDGKIISYKLRRSSRAIHARLEISPETGLIVVVPQHYPLSRVSGIIADKKRWVTAKLELFHRNRQEFKSDGNSARYLGHKIKVTSMACDKSHRGACLTGDELVLYMKPEGDNRKAIETWFKRQAHTIIKELAEKHCQKIGVRYQTLRIRSARTRWGSCSPGGVVSFNWKLVMAPLPALEYVVIHELCHLKELNHSKAFWELVESHCPDWRAQRKCLRTNEGALTL